MEQKDIFLIQDFITSHINEDLNLYFLANKVALSPFHFHRLYKNATGETVYNFIQRKRLERACFLLSSNQNMKIIDIALQSRFSSHSSFSKAFRIQYHISPSEYRKKESLKNSNNGTSNSKADKDTIPSIGYLSEETLLNLYHRRKRMNVKVEKIPGYRIAYMRNIGPYGTSNNQIMQKLKRWAITKDLLNESSIILGIAQDDPHITPADKCRYDTCLVVTEEYKMDSEVNENFLPGGEYGVLQVSHIAEAIGNAWKEILTIWLPESGYKLDERPCFERYLGASISTKIEPLSVEICIPIKKA